MSVPYFYVKLIRTKMIARKVKLFIFKTTNNNTLKFTPGQFITLLFKNKDKKLKRRSYSIANIKNDYLYIEIAASYIKDGTASEYLFNVKNGIKIQAIGPIGKLTLKKNEKIENLILISTGTGVLPYRSMLKTIKEITKKNVKQTYILMGAQYRQDIIYVKDFYNYHKKITNINITICLSKEKNTIFIQVL